MRLGLLAALTLLTAPACAEEEPTSLREQCCPPNSALDLYIDQVTSTSPGVKVCEQARRGNPYGLNPMTFAEAKEACEMCTCEPYQPTYGQAYLTLPDAGP